MSKCKEIERIMCYAYWAQLVERQLEGKTAGVNISGNTLLFIYFRVGALENRFCISGILCIRG